VVVSWPFLTGERVDRKTRGRRKRLD
jgi:hypothetical protein